jgi:hypothetical protein
MRGAIHPLPQYAFMAWCLVKAQGQLYFYVNFINYENYLWGKIFKLRFILHQLTRDGQPACGLGEELNISPKNTVSSEMLLRAWDLDCFFGSIYTTENGNEFGT